MNQSSLSVTDSSKSAALLKAASSPVKQPAEAAESSESFLSKLAKLFSSDDKEAVKSSATEAAGDVKKLEAEGKSVEAVAELDAEVADETLLAEEASAEGEIKPALSESDNADAQADGQKANVSGQQAMQTGNELLERLDESNQALQPGSGKELPLKTAGVEGSESEPDQLAGTTLLQQGTETADSGLSDAAGAARSDNKAQAEPVIPPELRKWLNVESDPDSVPQEPGDEEQTLPSGLLASAAGKVNSPESDWQPQPEASLNGEQLNRVMIQGKEVALQPDDTEQVAASTPLVWGDQQSAGITSISPAQAESMDDLPVDITPEQLAALQAEMEKKPADPEQDWSQLTQASMAAEAGKGAAELSKLQHEQVASQHHLRGQQAQQQMIQQHQQATLQQNQVVADKAAQLQAAAPTPGQAELMAVNMPQLQPDASVNKAKNLQSMTATLGVNGMKGMSADKAGDRKEADIAHQLAGLAGQQGVGQAQGRTEAQQVATTQTQSALQLNRDMAGEQLAERVQMMMSKNLKNVDIRLDPPELGRMHIRMTMHGDGASVQFTVANHQARDMVEQAMPRLREMLSQQGVQLADTSVQQQNSGQQGQYMAGNGSGGGSGFEDPSQDESGYLDESINLDVNIAAKDDGISYYA
jgi:flagellar hook-length control protein FliK